MGNRTGDLSSHSRSDATPRLPPQGKPLGPSGPQSPQLKAGWPVTLPALSFLAWLSQSRCVSPGREFIWNLNGDGYHCMHMEFQNHCSTNDVFYLLLHLWECSENAILVKLIESKQKSKLEFTLCKLLPAEREMLRDDSTILRVLPFPATHTWLG